MISYYILIICMFLIWIIDRIVFDRSNDYGNITLFFTLCFTMILYPLVGFIVSESIDNNKIKLLLYDLQLKGAIFEKGIVSSLAIGLILLNIVQKTL